MQSATLAIKIKYFDLETKEGPFHANDIGTDIRFVDSSACICLFMLTLELSNHFYSDGNVFIKSSDAPSIYLTLNIVVRYKYIQFCLFLFFVKWEIKVNR